MSDSGPSLADAFKVSTEADKVVIEFGHARGISASGQPTIRVTDRMMIPAAIAQRLLVQLDDALKPHAAALRRLEAQAMPPGRAAEVARPGAPPSRPPVDVSGTKAAQLISLVGDMGVPHQYERSFRLSHAGIQANRFLLTFNARDVAGDACERVLAICDRMSMPADARTAAHEAFPMANCVHLGFEGDADGIVCKLYLERAVPPEEARAARAQGAPVLLHLAFKWNLSRQDWVTTRYRWFPGLDADGIAGRIANLYAGGGASADLAADVLSAAATRVAAERLQYLEVDEAENSRRSFDLNLYNAKLQVRDIQPVLYRMRDRFAVRPGQFQALYDQVKGSSLGHLAGGLHRDGAEFFNLYYGVVSLPNFSDGFGSGR